jgi:LysM repeat protein
MNHQPFENSVSIMKSTPVFVFTLLLLAGSFSLMALTTAQAEIKDSIGIEKKDGKTFVLHQVDAKETLYSIARRYSAKVEDIKAANPTIGDGLKIGQTLRIPYKGVVAPIPGSTSAANRTYKSHTVEKKETLFAISRQYGVSVEEITKANPGIESGLKEGQTLRIPVAGSTASTPVSTPAPKGTKVHKVEAKETLFGIAKKYNVSVDDIKKANPELIDGLKEGAEIIIPSKDAVVRTTPAPAKTEPTYTAPVYQQTKGEFKKMTESGTAELLESKSDAPKFQALHRTAPIGTIIQVVNESNNQKIFVRVVGKLTDVSDSKVIIKISPKAFERLDAKEKRISVSLTYIP